MFEVESQGAIDVIAPTEPLNHENAQELSETLEKELSQGQPMVVLDLSSVPLMDSAGLESLLEAQQSLQWKGGILKLAGPTKLGEDILRITGVGEQFETYRDVKLAAGSFAR